MYTELDFTTNNDFPQHNKVKEDVVGRPHILILEDDLTFKPLWTNAIHLSSPHAQIDWVQAAEAAERCIKVRQKMGQKYDLVIADIFLSGRKTGIDLWSRYGDIIENFIFVSSLPRKKFNMLIEAEEFSYPIYLQKPLKASTCVEIVKQLLSPT